MILNCERRPLCRLYHADDLAIDPADDLAIDLADLSPMGITHGSGDMVRRKSVSTI